MVPSLALDGYWVSRSSNAVPLMPMKTISSSRIGFPLSKALLTIHMSQVLEQSRAWLFLCPWSPHLNKFQTYHPNVSCQGRRQAEAIVFSAGTPSRINPETQPARLFRDGVVRVWGMVLEEKANVYLIFPDIS